MRGRLLTALVTAAVFAIGYGSARAEEAAGIEYSLPVGKWSHPAIEWKEFSPGMEYAEVTALKGGKAIDSLHVFRIDPVFYSFRVTHADSARKPKPSDEWGRELGAELTFNGNMVYGDGSPIGMLISDGKQIGRTHKHKKGVTRSSGMFLAEPKNGKPEARIADIDARYGNEDVDSEEWNQGMEGGRMILDERGRVRVAPSEYFSSSTVICEDRRGRILVTFNQGRETNMFERGRFLRDSGLDIYRALYLDGGAISQFSYDGDTSFVYQGRFERNPIQGDLHNPNVPPGLTKPIGTSVSVLPRELSGQIRSLEREISEFPGFMEPVRMADYRHGFVISGGTEIRVITAGERSFMIHEGYSEGTFTPIEGFTDFSTDGIPEIHLSGGEANKLEGADEVRKAQAKMLGLLKKAKESLVREKGS